MSSAKCKNKKCGREHHAKGLCFSHYVRNRYCHPSTEPIGFYKTGLKKNNKSTYTVWHLMKQRCLNPNNPNFKDYGGRGISICRRWFEFKNFLEDMGPRPLNRSIDRKNNDGNYNKKNCRWATASQQAFNRGRKT